MDRTEFLIVGGGLAGTLLAFEMLEHNQDFKIISSLQKVPASEVAAGMFNPLVFKRLTKSWMVDDLLPVMRKKYQQLEFLLGKEFYHEMDILKPLTEQEKLLWNEKILDSEFSKYIISVTDSSRIDYLTEASGYGQVTGSGYVNLKVFMEQAYLFFKRKNLLIDGVFDFNKIKPDSNNFKIEGINASKVVFCEGVYITSNPYFKFVKMVPTKGELLEVSIPNLSEEFILNKQVFILPVGNHRFKVGSTYDWKDLSWQPTEQGKLSITERLQNLIRTQYRIENHWAGVRPAMSDRRPVLGTHPKYKSLYLFNGLGTKGMMLAPYFASEMFNLLTDKSYMVNSEVGIRRFF